MLTGDVSFTYGLPHWALVLIGASLVLSAIGVLSGALVKALSTLLKLAAAADRIDKALPILLEIAAEFKPNSGKTLHDRLLRIDTITSDTNATVTELHSYTHERVHAIVGILTRVAPTLDLVQRLAGQLGPTPKPPPNL